MIYSQPKCPLDIRIAIEHIFHSEYSEEMNKAVNDFNIICREVSGFHDRYHNRPYEVAPHQGFDDLTNPTIYQSMEDLMSSLPDRSSSKRKGTSNHDAYLLIADDVDLFWTHKENQTFLAQYGVSENWATIVFNVFDEPWLAALYMAYNRLQMELHKKTSPTKLAYQIIFIYYLIFEPSSSMEETTMDYLSYHPSEEENEVVDLIDLSPGRTVDQCRLNVMKLIEVQENLNPGYWPHNLFNINDWYTSVKDAIKAISALERARADKPAATPRLSKLFTVDLENNVVFYEGNPISLNNKNETIFFYGLVKADGGYVSTAEFLEKYGIAVRRDRHLDNLPGTLRLLVTYRTRVGYKIEIPQETHS